MTEAKVVPEAFLHRFCRYDCGCIGVPMLKSGSAFVFRACDGDDRHVGPFARDMSGKKIFELLTEFQLETLFREMGALVNDGYNYRDLRSHLKFMIES